MTLRVVVAASLDAGGPVFHESTHTGIDDLWDETITALLRAALHHDGVRPFAGYAHTAIHRACWRYVVRQAVKRPATTVLEDVDRECAVVGYQGREP
jgi:DNA-directed RNA polymerase specialized sigma24 family protein